MEKTHPLVTEAAPVCKGHWLDNTACGTCPKCRMEVAYLISTRGHERERAARLAEETGVIAEDGGMPGVGAAFRVLAEAIRGD